MGSQKFSHPNELLAMAALDAAEDFELFSKQHVQLIGDGEVQWDFNLHNGKEWHFRQQYFHLQDEVRLKQFKENIRHVLRKESGR